MVSALVLTILTGCASTGTKRIQVLDPGPGKISNPEIPADLKTCFNHLTGFPEGATLSRKQIADLLLKVRRSEIEKSKCGRRLIAWYNAIR